MANPELSRLQKELPQFDIPLDVDAAVEGWPTLMETFDSLKPVLDNATSDEVLRFIQSSLEYYFSK
jgi:hypothetical protein